MSKKKFRPRTEDQIKAQIAARVAPAPRPANVIKKVYKEGSPGALRLERGATLTAVKKSIMQPDAKIIYGVDEQGLPTGEIISVEPVVNTRLHTQRRLRYISGGLLGRSNIGHKARHVRNSYAACNTKKAA